jgi:hypothetical protein
MILPQSSFFDSENTIQNYIPISQYLHPSDVNSDSFFQFERFCFYLDDELILVVRKSLASFLSRSAQKCLSHDIFEFNISIKLSMVDHELVKNSLIGLLSGSPIIVTHHNYKLFEVTFNELGNDDFQKFFKGKPPSFESDFYLSIHSLKQIQKYNVELTFLSSNSLPGFSIPIGLIHLFWKSLKVPFVPNLFENFSKNQIEEGIFILNNMINGSFSQLSSSQVDFFLFIQIHSDLLYSLCRSFCYPISFTMPNIRNLFLASLLDK